jgi:hypothetical protein
MSVATQTNFANNSIDLSNSYVTKAYAMDNYPSLFPTVSSPELYVWGTGFGGMLGNGSLQSYSSPIRNLLPSANGISQISVGYQAVGAVRKDKTLWMWGSNVYGEVGDGTTVSKTSPVTVSGGIQWSQVSVGSGHTVAIDVNGGIWSWGLNTYGQLGDGTTSNRSSPVSLASRGVWKTAASGDGTTYAIDIEGILWAWGFNSIYGSLGDGTTLAKSSPVTVVGNKRWKSVYPGFYGGPQTTLAIDTDNKIWGWGYNGQGQMGDGTTLAKSSPVSFVGNNLSWDQVCSNGLVSGAISTNGTLWMWGSNQYGLLGINASPPASTLSPVTTTGGGTNWKQLFFTQLTAFGLKTDGTIWSWGGNPNGMLGINSTLPSSVSSPVLVTRQNPNSNNWKFIPTNGAAAFTMAVVSEDQGY